MRRPDMWTAICMERELECKLGTSWSGAHCNNEEEERKENFQIIRHVVHFSRE